MTENAYIIYLTTNATQCENKLIPIIQIKISFLGLLSQGNKVSVQVIFVESYIKF